MGDVRDIIATAEALGPTEPAPLPEPIASYEDDADPLVRGTWTITTQTSADWALQRLGECEAEEEAIDAQVAEAMRRLEERAETLKERARRGSAFFRFKLMDYAERERVKLLGTGRKKSKDFLHGKIGWRYKAARLVVTDKAALEAWLPTQPVESGVYRVRYEPEMKALQEHFTKDGVIPPGCDTKPSEDVFYAEAEAPETALAKGKR